MSPEIAGIVGLGGLIFLLFCRMWIGAAMALVGFLGYAYILGINPAFGVIAQIPFSTVAYYPMSTVPLFILMGEIILSSGIGVNLYDTAYKWLGQLRGGLAMSTTLACALFAAITGVSSPAIVTMGKVAIPEMRKRHYRDQLATGSIVAAGGMAFLIPPSMAFIIYGIITEQSIGKLFMAGIFPGILLCALFMITITIITSISPDKGPAGPKTSFRDKIGSLKGTWHTILLFLLVLGGIYGGIFTPTEAGGIGAFGALVITVGCRLMSLRSFIRCLLEACEITAMVFLLIIGAYILMKFLAVSGLPGLLSETVASLTVPRLVILSGILLLYVFLGMFLDIFSAVIMTIPVIFPVIVSLGFDPIWFGVVMVIVMQMGLVTPPLGMDVYILSGAIGVKPFTIFTGVLPFIAAMIICIVLLVIFPEIALFIPSIM
ncbi:MAG: TRAP transporter large permease subunit [Desulfobacteraceae bacterium]|nr:TRAP transporter large permease subunit [Desulfobacteraceae bacterium]